MIPLCNVDGVASVLFTKRSGLMRAHKNEVCFPGGKVRLPAPVITHGVMWRLWRSTGDMRKMQRVG